MLNYFNRFRRYVGEIIESKYNNKNDDSNAENENENIEARQAMFSYSDSSASPVQTPLARHSIGGAVRKLKRSATTKTCNSGKDYLSAPESSEEENSTARLSRRSSVLVNFIK